MFFKSALLLVLATVALGEDNLTKIEEEELKTSINEFGFNLLKIMAEENPQSNVALAPVTVAGLLGMALMGSIGSTHSELANALGFSEDILSNRARHDRLGSWVSAGEDSSGGGAVLLAADERLRPLYRQFLQRVYRSDVVLANFTDTVNATKLINDWVSEATQGALPEFLPGPLSPRTRMALLTAQSFAANWEHPFIKEHTRKMPFYKSSGEVLDIDQMLNFGKFEYTHSFELGCHMVSLPYANGSSSLVALQSRRPDESLWELVSRLSWAQVEGLLASLTSQPTVVRFPRVSVTARSDLAHALQAMGVRDMFSAQSANFALMVAAKDSDEPELRLIEPKDLAEHLKMLRNPGLHIDAVLHTVAIDIDEEGTRAAAAAAGVLARSARQFLADSPFLLLLRDRRGLVLFSALVEDPTAA